jgi:hypothetical protein
MKESIYCCFPYMKSLTEILLNANPQSLDNVREYREKTIPEV